MASLLKNASLIQKTLDTKKKQEAASTAATQSGSTSTPTTTSTPKVTSTPKAQPFTQTPVSTTPPVQAIPTTNTTNLKDINLFWTKSTSTLSSIREQTWATWTKVETSDLFSAKEEEPYQSHLQKWFNIEPWEKTKEVVTNLFDKLRPASKKIVDTSSALKDYREVAKEERKEATKDFEKRYTPEWLKQYFNYYEDTLWETVRPMAWNLMYTSLDTIKWVTNWISNSIESLSNRMPDQWLLVRKWILPASQTQEEIEEEKKRLQANREAITASILDTVYAWEKRMDSTEIWKETKAVEWMSLLDALKKWDTNAVRWIIWNQIWYILPSVWAWIVWWDVWVASSIFPVMYQETLDDYMNDPSIVENNSKEKIHWMATASAWIQTAIEIISLETQILKPIRNTKLSNEISKKVTQPVVSRILWQWIKWSVAEWVEEVSQQWVEQKFAQLLGSNRALLTVDDYADIWLEAFIMWLIISWPWAVVEWVSTKRQTLVYNENIRKLREEIPWLTDEEAKEILNAVIDYEEKEEDAEKLEEKATKLYDNRQNITNQINQLRENPTQTSQYEIPLLENKLQEIDKAIVNIDKKINSLYKPMEEATKNLNKWQPTQEQIQADVEQTYKNMIQSWLENVKDELLLKQQTQLPKQEWWKNLSLQTMKSIQVNQNEPTKYSKKIMQKSFERSVEQIERWEKEYHNADFATYAYWTSWKYIQWNQEQNEIMINKINSLLNKIWMSYRFSKTLWDSLWKYSQKLRWWEVSYKEWNKELIVYWHEVYHAMVDVIKNWELSDKQMQESLRRDMQEIINEAKEHLWLNEEKYSQWKYKEYADMYAEEWLSNAFWEYLANREIPELWPKTFRQKVKDFFNRIIDWLMWIFNMERGISSPMERTFRTISEWRVEWWIVKRSPYAQLRQMSAMDESFAETDDELRQTQWEEYDNMVKNTKQEQDKLDNWVNEIADNMEQVTTDVNDAQEQWEILDATIPEIENITQQPLEKAIPSTIDAVERSVDKQIKSKEKREAIKSVWEWFKNVLTPALSRLYNISPRLAWAVHTYQATTELKSLWYKRMSKEFADAMDKLRKKDKQAYRKLSLALFDYWMVEDIDIKEALKEAGIDPKLFEPVANVLNRIAQDYKDAWLDITINDKYFPRKVRDYGLLLDYMSRKAGKDIKDTRQDLLQYIEDTNKDATLSEWEKEKRIHAKLINEFTKPSERSNNAKERKLVLSEWQLTEEEKAKGYKNDIIDFYEDPIKSLDVYITDMVKKTELKKMLWWLTAEWKAISEDFDESVAWILLDMQAKWELTKEKADEAAYVIRSIINARATWKWISAIKNATYALTIANWFSAFQQVEDLSKTLLRWPSWFKNTIKSMIGRANIKMDDTWLDNIFAEFDKWNITNTLFKLSGFDMVDSLWKSSFLNTAYDSCVRQANGRKSVILETRLKQMYWESMGTEIFNAYKNDQLKDESWNINLSVMVDLLYQLGNTQPIYRSAMPTAYLNNPNARVFYCLMSFTVKQVDWFIQWTKEVYNNQLLLWRDKATAAAAATWRCIWATTLVSVITALVTSVIDWAKWDDDDAIWNKIADEWWLAWLKQLWIDSLSWLFKIFNISRYDQYIFKREWIEWVLLSKITPAPVWIASDLFDILVWKKELADLWRYWPLFLKPLYYQFKAHDMLPDYKLWWWASDTAWKSTWISPSFRSTNSWGWVQPKFRK